MLRQYSIKLSKLWEALRVSSRINAPNADGWTALHLAAATPHAERGLRVLLRAQAEVSPAHPVSGMTPLMLSAEAGMDKALRMLLSSGASQAELQLFARGQRVAGSFGPTEGVRLFYRRPWVVEHLSFYITLPRRKLCNVPDARSGGFGFDNHGRAAGDLKLATR
ncbi:unnamed protein product [Cladocopium goreaui]|uniref:Ankyrin repeats (3 copies) n=1 Tax=Cladocopium goreaui TaxID=2562237 RepID=A0A9P1FZJ4_9DINO|nr:unnamed protein product [Cladocopium goreaui]